MPIDPSRAEVAEFAVGDGRLALDHPLSKAALLVLGNAWPRPIFFEELVGAAVDRLGGAPDTINNFGEHLEALLTVLFRTYAAGALEVSSAPPAFTREPGPRPEASLLARIQAKNGAALTTLRHETVHVEDELARKFLLLVDGNRTLDDLVREMRLVVAADATPADADAISPASVGRMLELLAGLALLRR